MVLRGGEPLYLNRTLLELAGYRDLGEFRAADGLNQMFRGRDAQTLAEASEGGAIPLVAAGGELIAVDARVEAIEWDGAPATLLALRRSREVEYQERLRNFERETRDLRALLDSAADGVITLDESGRVLAMSRGAEALVRLRRQGSGGRKLPHPVRAAKPERSGGALRARAARGAAGPRRRGIRRPRPARPDAGARGDPGALRLRRRSAALLRGGARPRAVESDRTRAGDGARRRRTSQRPQDRVSRPHQPRSAHAAACDSRLRRSDDGGAVRSDRQRPLQGLRPRHPRFGAARHQPRQRPARSRQDRGGQDGARICAGRRQPHRARMRLVDAAAGGARAHHHAPVAVGPPATGDGRRARIAADLAQPAFQRGEVQRAGRTGDRLDRARRGRLKRSSACATPASA